MPLYLTDTEKKAVAKLLLEIVNADNKVHIGEALYFKQLQIQLNIDDSQINAAKSMNLFRALFIIRQMTENEKMNVAIMMHEMIKADGQVDDEELVIFNLACKLANIPL